MVNGSGGAGGDGFVAGDVAFDVEGRVEHVDVVLVELEAVRVVRRDVEAEDADTGLGGDMDTVGLELYLGIALSVIEGDAVGASYACDIVTALVFAVAITTAEEAEELPVSVVAVVHDGHFVLLVVTGDSGVGVVLEADIVLARGFLAVPDVGIVGILDDDEERVADICAIDREFRDLVVVCGRSHDGAANESSEK